MIIERKQVILILSLILLSARAAAELPNVIIISLSGVSNSDSIEDSNRQFMPRMFNDMIPQGTLYKNLRNRNVRFHMPIVQAINTGRRYPAFIGCIDRTIFDIVGKKHGLERTKIWSIGHWWDKNISNSVKRDHPLSISAHKYTLSAEAKDILNRQEIIFFERIGKLREEGTGWPNWDTGSNVVFTAAKKVFSRYKPKLVHYVVNDTESAHYGTYARYALSLRSIDSKIFELWNMIKDDPFYKDNTYFIVNVDHERDPYYMEHDKASGNVWMYIYGPDVYKGKTIERTVEHIDIFATAAYLMGIDTGKDHGAVLTDCMQR